MHELAYTTDKQNISDYQHSKITNSHIYQFLVLIQLLLFHSHIIEAIEGFKLLLISIETISSLSLTEL